LPGVAVKAAAPQGVLPGTPAPLGARWDGEGVNFAVHSAHAQRIELCLFDPRTGAETLRCDLTGRTGECHHAFVPAPLAGLGMLYGFRAHGPWEPERGLLFNAAKLLLDPCALDVVGAAACHPALQAADPRDSAPFVPRSRVVDRDFDWGRSRAPATPWRDTVIYELHVQGYTQLHPAVPPGWRGKYLGLTVPAVLDHLVRLGVTAVELMPCQAFDTECFLRDRGLNNYWGYNPLAWFAPDRRYAVEDPVREFKQMVAALHGAGLEVIVDVVFNHTAEGGAAGRVLSLKGLDNPTWYRLHPLDPREYENFTGCGNTVNFERAAVRRVVLDCLRYWAGELRVDGFRFDLAPVLGRGPSGFSGHAPLFAALRSDPLLAYTKLIAEPWDVGPGGYQLGRFPAGWSEWNDRYRDAVRAFWRGDHGMVPGLAERLAGSSDLFRQQGRRPSASVNFVTAHDGFTLHDLVSYSRKHNDANLEANRDGHDHNLSWNCGIEGPTADAAVNELRWRQMRNLLATLALSQGVPMLQAGDEFARSQGGNNNAYCQDNSITWLSWEHSEAQRRLAGFVARLLRLRREWPQLRRSTFLKGASTLVSGKDVRWWHPAGREMTQADWADGGLQRLGMGLRVARGELLVLFSADSQDTEFMLPEPPPSGWTTLIDTAAEMAPTPPVPLGRSCTLAARSLRILAAGAATAGEACTGRAQAYR
jgi:glycogen operon protein